VGLSVRGEIRASPSLPSWIRISISRDQCNLIDFSSSMGENRESIRKREEKAIFHGSILSVFS